MTYMDDSLHLAYSYDKVHWTALNDNNGILFAKNPGYRANPANGLQLRDPFLFRKQDGKFVLLATVTTSAGATTSSSIFAWDTDDLINYKNERTILMNSSNTPAKAPECKYDAANGNYVIYQTDGTQNYCNTTTDFVTVSEPVPYTGQDYPAAKPDITNAPAKAVSGSVIEVTQAELDKLIASLGTPKIPVGTKPVTVSRALGVQPALPTVAEVVYSDGTTTQHEGITWEPIDLSKLSKEGTFKVKGHIIY